MGNWRIGFHSNALLMAVTNQFRWGVANMRQHLIDHRLDVAAWKQTFKIVNQKNGDTDCSQLSGAVSVLKRFLDRLVLLKVALFPTPFISGLRAVYDHHIEIIKPHFFECLVNRP